MGLGILEWTRFDEGPGGQKQREGEQYFRLSFLLSIVLIFFPFLGLKWKPSAVVFCSRPPDSFEVTRLTWPESAPWAG